MIEQNVPIRGLKPWGNPYAMVPGQGYQVNWAKVSNFFSAGKLSVKANGAASVGADAITVDALTSAIRNGERIDFGTVETVVVTLDAALINATTVGCDPLSGPLPNGAILKTADSQEFLKLTAAAAEGAESLTVEAIPNALEGGETATFQGGSNVVEVTEDVAAGATSIPISNLVFGLADNAEGYLQREGFSSADKFIPEGTIMALDTTTTPTTQIPRKDATSEEANHFLVSDASNANLASAHSRSGYGTIVGGTFIYENLCPDADSDGNLPSAYKTELIANAHFKASDFVDYVDTRA